MHETLMDYAGQNLSPAGRAPWLPKPYVWALAIGIAIIGALTAYSIRRDYRATLALWSSRLSGVVVSRTWTLRSSLQESQDDTQVLADFASTRELSVLGKGGSAAVASRADLLKQVLGLFDEYKRVYEYAAICLLNPDGQVVVQATDFTSWAGLIQGPQVKEFVRAVARSGHYGIDTLRTPSEERALIFAMPVFARVAADKSPGEPVSPVGVVVILDPLARELIPLLEAERDFTRTGEALLLWSQDGEGHYASPRRYHDSGSAPVAASSDTLRQAIRLTVGDRAVFGQFVDYRGVAVLAAAQKIPSLDAAVICTVDRVEALADFHRSIRLQIISATAILVTYIGTILWLRRNAVGRELMARFAQQQAVLVERQRTEELLRTVNATLETRVAERTTQLAHANEQLRLELDELGRVERALRVSEERYRELIENAQDIIYTHDLDGRFTSLNKMGETCLGYTRDDILGTSILQVAGVQYQRVLQQLAHPSRRDREAKTYELEISSKQGKGLTLEVSPRIIFEEGKPVGVQGIARDLTERRKLEQQLVQAQKMEAVGQLAGGIAHDFNNLLMIILGYCEELSGQLPQDSRLKQQLMEIWNAGKRAASLTAQLLSFSRRKVVDPQVLDIDGVISDMDSMLQRVVGEGISLTTNLGVGLGRVKVDQGQLEQAILNLAVNARDAMPLGGSLTIETGSVDEGCAPVKIPVEPGPYIVLKVQDTGHGMAADVQEHIFEPFFTTKEQGKGTGLGLAMVYGVVKQAGGYIWVESAPLRGTTFNILLPQQEGPIRLEPEQEPTPPDLSLGTQTIFLVEDEEIVRVLLREVLQRAGYKVLEARQGEECLQATEGISEPIHLLITDIVMPQMGGLELARRLASSHPETRVLFISGYAGGASGHAPALPKDAFFLQKPFSPDVLVRTVQELLEQQTSRNVLGPNAITPAPDERF